MATRKPVAKAAPIPTRKQFNEWCDEQLKINHSFIPPDQLCEEDIDDWAAAEAELARVKNREMLLRLKIFKHFFTSPSEGVNATELPNGIIVKGTYKISRNVDEAALAALKQYSIADMRSFLTQLGMDVTAFADDVKVVDALKISTDKLLKYEPSLVTAEYRTLTEEQRTIFETCLAIKPATPSLEVKKP
jgi:hypothetical protein